jgi:hypothetical protein
MITFIIVSFGDKYIRYKNALIRSIEANVKDANIKDIQLEETFSNFHTANYIKLKAWRNNIEGNSVLIDADTIVLDDVSEVFNMPHDLIYTKRDYNRSIPFNSGVVFVKESGKQILDRWCDIDQQMFTDPIFHQKWKKKYFGFNQASFGCLLETMPELNIGQVNATYYNSCDQGDWVRNAQLAKIVHVKSFLRESIDKNLNSYPEIENRIKKYYL